MILLIDNYDSFVHNLARYLRRLGQETTVVRNDQVDVAAVGELSPQAIVISPGPCTPKEAGCSVDLVRSLGSTIPILGVCLGHQAIGTAFGARIQKAPEPYHGRTSRIHHDGDGVFTGLPNPLTVCRYHSLAITADSLPAELEVTAETDDRVVMAVRHRRLPVVGLQFHPESILTVGGYALLKNFLRMADIRVTAPAEPSGELQEPGGPALVLPEEPVTF